MSLFRRITQKFQSTLPDYASTMSQGPMSRPGGDPRKDLLVKTLRDTMQLHGVPADWLVPMVVYVSKKDQEPELHLRLLVRHWERRLMIYAYSFENSVLVNLTRRDPSVLEWFQGFSWQFDLGAGADCPVMPHVSAWGKLSDDTGPGGDRVPDRMPTDIAELRSEAEDASSADGRAEKVAVGLGFEATDSYYMATAPLVLSR